VVYLSKSDASEGFDQIMDSVSAHTIKRDLYLDDADGLDVCRMRRFLRSLYEWCLSAKMTAWNEFSCSMAFDVIRLATGRKFNFSKYIFDSMVRNVDSPSKVLMYLRFLQAVMDNQVDDMTTHNTRYTSPDLTHKVFLNMRRVGKGFSGVETPLFASMMVQPQPQAEEEIKDQPTTPHESSMPLLTTLMETCATLSKKVVELENDKLSQALEILRLKKRVKKLEKKKKSKSSLLKRLRRVAIDADEDVTLMDVVKDEEVVTIDAEPHGSVAEPIVFDDKDVTMTMALTLIKLKAEKAKLLDEQIAPKLHDKERNQRKREWLMRHCFKKLRAANVSGSESTQETPSNDPKEMTEEDVQNMLEIIPVLEFKVEALQVKYPIIDWEIHTEGSGVYWKIIRVEGITEAYQVFEDILKGFDREDIIAL
nr:hypothetical protein [Tanacetum cinerariifolium]